MASIPTMRVKGESGEMIINADDFDPSIHKAIDPAPSARADEKTSEPDEDSFQYDPDAHELKHFGAGKWFAVDGDGEKVAGPFDRDQVEALKESSSGD